jgi:tetratricopeptide (TPR) repeat protein
VISYQTILDEISALDELISSRERDPESAKLLYGTVYHKYWERDYAGAEEYLKLARDMEVMDARLWYYQGFVELALGKREEARLSFAHAVKLHAALPRVREVEVNASLQRIQGTLRIELHTALGLAKAQQVKPSIRGSLVAGK